MDGSLVLAVLAVAVAIGLMSRQEDAPAPAAAATTSLVSSSTSQPSTAPVVAAGEGLSAVEGGAVLPNPWTVDDRFECYGGSTADIATCASYDLSAARANLDATVEVLVRGRDLPELREAQAEWEAEVTALCELSLGGGSADRYNMPFCQSSAANDRAEFLRIFDPANDYPINPVDLWEQPLTDFDDECRSRLTGSLVGEPRNSNVVSQESSVEFQLGQRWNVTGIVEMSAELESPDGAQRLSVDSSAKVWGRHIGDVAAGIFVETAAWDDDEPTETYGYWWIEVDGETAVGEMIALFQGDAVSALALASASC